MKDNKLYDSGWLNSFPINRKAREMLNRAGEKPDPAGMHSVQLAKWGIDRGMIEVENSVFETVEAMMTWRPVRLANFFLISVGGDYNPAGWEEAATPLDLATIILNEIEEKMMLHFPWYSDF